MMIVEAPQSFVVAQECEKVAWQNGYRRGLGEEKGWACFESTSAKGEIYLAATCSSGPWFLAIGHAGVIGELDRPACEMSGPGLVRYTFSTLTELYTLMPRVYELGVSLPDRPLDDFLAKVKDLPRKTEAERLVIQRIGQDIFRNRLMSYWQGTCHLTGITDPALLRASHIIPWKECSDDAERLNVHNGLLLSALWDAAFDKGLVTFDDAGKPVFSSALSEAARSELNWSRSISLTDEHRNRLVWHRARLFNQSSR